MATTPSEEDFVRLVSTHKTQVTFDRRRAARILYLRHVQGYTLRQCANDAGVTKERIRQILAETWRFMRWHLREYSIEDRAKLRACLSLRAVLWNE